MQAIITKYLSPTNHRGPRVKATATSGTVTVPWDHALGIGENHDAAARALVKKLGWDNPSYGILVKGGLPDSTGNAYVFVRPRVEAERHAIEQEEDQP
jgi:hypothetical protein